MDDRNYIVPPFPPNINEGQENLYSEPPNFVPLEPSFISPQPYGIPTESDSTFILPTPSEVSASPSQLPPTSENATDKKPTEEPLVDQGLIDKPDHEPHVILTKRFPLLPIVYVIVLISGTGIFAWGFHEVNIGEPPTELSQTAYSDTLYSLIFLFLSSIFSIIVLHERVHNLAIGYTVMFTFVVTFYFALKGASRAFFSIKYDDIVTIEKYVFNTPDRFEGELPQFFHRLQMLYQCCGTNELDKMKGWPELLQSQDMPGSCCKKPKPGCGKFLARTSRYNGTNKGPMRMPSGYFISMSENEMNDIINSGIPIKIMRPPGKNQGMHTFLKIIKEFYFTLLAERYPPNTPREKMFMRPNDIVHPIIFHKDELPSAIGCRYDASLEKVTTVGWQIQDMLDYETTVIYSELSYTNTIPIAWKIPQCHEKDGTPPFHLASNFKRQIVSETQDIKHMWYVSKGITENFILKNEFWESNCEHKKNIPFVPELKLVSLITGEPKINGPTVGKFFIYFLNKLMLACIAITVVVGIMLLMVFLIFWKYYAKIKLEEYANLPYPPEFDELKVRQKDLYIKHDEAEYDKQKSERLKREDEEKENDHEPSYYDNIRDDFDKMFAPTVSPSPSPSLAQAPSPVTSTVPPSSTMIMPSDTSTTVQ